MTNDICIADGYEDGYFINVLAISENGKFYANSGYNFLLINIKNEFKSILKNDEYPRYRKENYQLIDCNQYYKIHDENISKCILKIGPLSYIKVDKKTFVKLKLKL